jgi:phosphatidylglycerophosphate synthase
MKRSRYNPANYSESDIYKAAKYPDSFWTVIIIDPIAFKITRLIANKLKNITPNQITIISLIVGLISAFCFFRATYPYLILGGILFEISILFDCIDGKLARATGQTTLLGKKLEFIRDKSFHIINLVGLSIGQFLLSSDHRILFISGIYFILLCFYWLLYRSPLINFLSLDYKLPHYKRILLIPISAEFTAFAFFLGPLLNKPFGGLSIAIFLMSIAIVFRIYQFVQKR